MSNPILDTGISIAYEAENSPPIVDIVFVHGLQGHPFKTWTYRPKTSDALESSALTGGKGEKRSVFNRMRWKSSKAKPLSDVQDEDSALSNGNEAHPKPVFWPADLLPEKCPNSRILVFGYDSKITKYTAGAINQNSIFSHSKDLLFALSRERNDPDRPIIFVAHSLGGIVVKEMLVRSSSALNPGREIVKSTAAVVFLGTPHRGSKDVAALGEVVRSVISSFGMETTSVILDALGLKSPDLQRSQEDFSMIWEKHDFQVKTFQEGLNLAKLGEKVVPDYSSLIGDYRENAETLQANHIEMCRYSGFHDPNFRKVAGELRSIYDSIARIKSNECTPLRQSEPSKPILIAASSKKSQHHVDDNQVSEACLGSLWFSSIDSRIQSLENPAHETCKWLFRQELYRDWFDGRSRQKSYGLLWLKGKPGAGKSTLMKEAFRQAKLKQTESNYCTAAFFFNAKGTELEHSCLGLFRSLLYQLLPGDQTNLQCFQSLWNDKKFFLRETTNKKVAIWAESELKGFFESMMARQTNRRTMIFIDAIDECDESEIRPMAYFWRTITKSAYQLGIDLNVCLSSRHFPTITLSDCPEIIVEQHNGGDIAAYVDHKLQLGIKTQDNQWKLLKENILKKSSGVFLWVVLVVEDVLKNSDDGKGMSYLMKLVTSVPEELQTLFSDMFSNLEPMTKEVTVRFFQWAILATKPLRLHEWHQIMAFIQKPALRSLSEWRQSDNYTESDEQLEKQIRSISKGLVEVKKAGAGDSQDDGVELISVYAGAGSLSLEHGDTRIVQVIHESVREFFLANKGFSVLDSALESNPIGNGHLAIMSTCLDYLDITELDALVNARKRVLTSSWKSIEERGSPKKRRLNEPLTKTDKDASVFEMLRSLDSAGPNIVAWMTDTDASERTCSNQIPCKSAVTRSSDKCQSQILEDYPALLSYATFKLFAHAQLAEKTGADPGPFINRLKVGSTWTRWVTLREDIPKGMGLGTYAAKMGLQSWLEVIDGDDGIPAHCSVLQSERGSSNGRGPAKKIFLDGQASNDQADASQSPPQRMKRNRNKLGYIRQHIACGHCRRRKLRCIVSTADIDRCVNCVRLKKECRFSPADPAPPRSPPRPRSVASFGSAGSHDGHNHIYSVYPAPAPIASVGSSYPQDSNLDPRQPKHAPISDVAMTALEQLASDPKDYSFANN
ncbi:hypothetical protein V8C35DRAFT_44056 [Trichoderma chlorosporum]